MYSAKTNTLPSVFTIALGNYSNARQIFTQNVQKRCFAKCFYFDTWQRLSLPSVTLCKVTKPVALAMEMLTVEENRCRKGEVSLAGVRKVLSCVVTRGGASLIYGEEVP